MKESEGVHIVVVGDAWTKCEMSFLRQAGMGERVHLLTEVDDDRLRDLYRSAAAFVYPSFHEGFGLPLLEALACGCPVIASRIPSTIEVAGNCPVYFDPASIEDFRVAITVGVSEGRSSDRVSSGQERAARYSWVESARRTLDVYRAVSGRR